jgi:hypothetical protein
MQDENSWFSPLTLEPHVVTLHFSKWWYIVSESKVLVEWEKMSVTPTFSGKFVTSYAHKC